MGEIAWLLVIFASNLGIVISNSDANPCPSTIKCITSDNYDSCRERGLHFQNNVHFGKCCPGCIQMPEFNETCSATIPCAPGLICKDETNVCELATKGCEATRREMETRNSVWVPDCIPGDKFAPKQCKGELMSGRCFCFDPDGGRIFGEEEWSKAENMTCACSRLMWETLKVRPDASLHCTSQGNFEELQCDDGACWCAREQNGEAFSSIVPEKMMKALPCYNFETHGDSYLRNCDSQRVRQEQARKLLSIHGTENINFPPVSCNYDGSYARVQTRGNFQVCTAKDGKTIVDYPSANPTCNCAYDQFISEVDFILTCETTGNYSDRQSSSGTVFCVDSDGYAIDCKLTP